MSDQTEILSQFPARAHVYRDNHERLCILPKYGWLGARLDVLADAFGISRMLTPRNAVTHYGGAQNACVLVDRERVVVLMDSGCWFAFATNAAQYDSAPFCG
jgi:hypothetical protein